MTQSFPLLPLRDIVVFPHMIVPLFVGRDRSVAAQSSNEVAIGLIQVKISRELVGRRFAVEARKALTLGVSEVTGGHTVRNFQLLRRARAAPISKANFFAKHMCETKSFCSNFRTALGGDA